MKKIFFILISCIVGIQQALAIGVSDIGFGGSANANSILNSSNTVLSYMSVLTMIQSILLKVVFPLIIVGASIYIAYELFMAEGDESRLKKAWKSVAYTSVALIAVALSYAIVSIVSRFSI